ncbi:MAG TPA: hypothetical protein VFI92_14825 [Steroidobacteraceae bacterium]|nr:hypothetical protein [Steroidobacteraceae bacterium]
MRAPVRRLLLPLALLPALEGHASTPLPASGELTCERTALGGCDFRDPESGVHFVWPNDWPVRRLVLVTETGPSARARQRDATRWIAIEYLPDDPSQPQSTLIWVAVLPRADWIAQSGLPSVAYAPGVEVATSTRYVAVAGVSAVNPYPFESRDAEIFDALRPSLQEVSLFVQFPQ